jgi:hypothetical protein
VESLETLEKAYRIARDAGATRLSMLAALQLSGALFDLEHRDAAAEWLQLADSVAAETAPAAWPFELTLLRIDMALADGNATLAKQLSDAAEAQGQFGNSRRGSWGRAFRLRLRQLGFGRPLTDVEIDDVLDTVRGRNFMAGLRDLEIAVVLFHFAEPAPAQARAIATRSLLQERRTLSPVAMVLRQALSAAHADDLIDGWRIRPRSYLD